MVDVNEPTRIAHRLNRSWELLEDADINDRDRDAIRAFVTWRRDSKGLARNTLRSDISNLKCSAERAAVPLLDMGLEDVERLFSTLVAPSDAGGYGLSRDGSAIFGYSRTLRLFFRYLDGRDSYDAYAFHDDIELPEVEVRGASNRDAMLTGEEIEAIKDATTNARDRALVSLLGDIGGRIGLVLSLRVGDVHLDGDEPYLTPNTDVEDGLKDLSLEAIPILHSRADLRAWLRHPHPAPDMDEAPLWAIRRGFDRDEAQQCALSDSRARNLIRDAAERAGVKKPTDPHNFRRTAATRLSNSDRLTPQEIQSITGWKSSTLSEMIDVYDYTSDAERASAIHQALGFSAGTEDDENALTLESLPCGTCRETVSTSADYCPNCGAPQDEVARKVKDTAENEAVEDIASAETDIERLLGQAVFERVKNDPEALETVKDELGIDV
ncbi:tyrosine-type recombinase/integrase [Halomarina oriensis]|uniref:Tyrosine-type recombinase/integrase n=1 Tax=Halomarina oriensis TaxID=671145 RepID=A0A6B0GRT1_9EURY|nr:tyrosine-type recombinase/integrase [Halomarina oriensis]MWG34785.1 tyrosine-type recombinase/integrase [Halomarina oriensis]